MQKPINWIIPILLTPLLSLVIWLVTDALFINIAFYVSIILFIVSFILIIIQDGVLDATSYGFRRIRYQLSSKKRRTEIEKDSFFNPKEAKKVHYHVYPIFKTAAICNVCYLILNLIIALTL